MTEGGGDGALVTVLTPPGGGGIAVVRLTAPDARARLLPYLDVTLPDRHARPGTGRLQLCWFVDAGERVDRVLIRTAGSTPWFGPGMEICCHGGLAAARRIVASLMAGGLTARPPKEIIRLPRLEAEAWEALIGARSELAVRVFAGELSDGMARCLRASGGCLPAPTLRAWLANGASGRALRKPPRVVIVGPSNAGKSTLFNALIGRDRALVADAPGTTRDPLRAELNSGGYVLELWDTAGAGAARSSLEEAAQAGSRAAARHADLVVWVSDTGGRWGDEERVPASLDRCLLVASKADRASSPGPPGWIPVAARTGLGLDRLVRLMRDRLGLLPAEQLAGPTPFRRRHVDCIQKMLGARDASTCRGVARDLLG